MIAPPGAENPAAGGGASRWSVRALLAPAIAVFTGVAYSVWYYPMPIPFDEFLALPIARAIAEGGAVTGDLLVDAGRQTPFYLYHAAAALYRAGLDVDVWWYAALIVSLVATFAATWAVARAAGAGPLAAALTTVLVACSNPSRGTLNWSWMPQRGFVSASVGFPVALLALALALNRRTAIALFLAAVACWIHPGYGAIACLACGTLHVINREAGSRRRRLAQAVPAVAVAAGAAITVAVRVPSNFMGDRAAFIGQFETFALHAWIGDHWREGYGWFFLLCALATLGLRAMSHSRRRWNAILLVSLLTIAAAWQAAVYLPVPPAILLLFLIRATALAKPLAFAIAAIWLVSRSTHPQRGLAVRLAGAVLVVSAIVTNVAAAETMAAAALCALLGGESDLRGKPLAIAALAVAALVSVVALFGGAPDAAARLTMIIAGLTTCIVIIGSPGSATSTHQPEPEASEIGRVAAASGLVLVIAVVMLTRDPHGWVPARPFRISERLHFSRPQGEVRALEQWARDSTPHGALFAVPPLDPAFVPFRLRAQRGVYAHVDDINQLAYHAQKYLEAGTRLSALGIAVRGRHEFSDSGYLMLAHSSLRALRRGGVRYFVVPQGAPPQNVPVVWRNRDWLVYDLAAVP